MHARAATDAAEAGEQTNDTMDVVEEVPAGLRIVSLLPSATEIVGSLGLAECLVGVTHECDCCPDEAGMGAALSAGVKRVTSSAIDPHTTSQADIDAEVKKHVAAAAADASSTLPPLYSVDHDAMTALAPTVVLTQSLCRVCAVSSEDVKGSSCTVHSGAPNTLAEVASSIEAIGAACGVPLRGKQGRDAFEAHIAEVTAAVDDGLRRSGAPRPPPPRVLLLEWLDPVFDGGHWVPGMVRAAGCVPALNETEGARSTQRTWADVMNANPDVVLIACCGFDLQRNRADAVWALRAPDSPLAKLRAVISGRAYVLDGNRYFARPSPTLAAGTALVARCAYDGHPEVAAALERLPFYPAMGEWRDKAWARLEVPAPAKPSVTVKTARLCTGATRGTTLNTVDPGAGEGFTTQGLPMSTSSGNLADIEDFDVLHEKACNNGEDFYIDPKTGYMVMTKVKHQNRGKCCGSGCRHCPYGHVNVKDKAMRIQVPALIHKPTSGLAPEVTVLMWSGGKDSFLALRAMLKPGGVLHEVGPSGVVLLTTFDAATRMVAHQEVSIRDIERQAKHLDVGLVGVPLHRNGGTGYVARLKGALEVLTEKLRCKVTGLACGDLHLEHIRSWREDTVGKTLGLSITYPVWSDVAGKNYPALATDLVASGVPCKVTAVTEDKAEAAGATVGAAYIPEMAEAVARVGLDAFGENGEFHTLAQVWEVPRKRALGLSS